MNTQTTTDTKFSHWLKDFGVANVVAEMNKRGRDVGVTLSAVYQWERQEHEPRPKKQRALVEISGGKLTLQDIADHFEAKAKT